METTRKYPRTMQEAFGAHTSDEIDDGEPKDAKWFAWALLIIWIATLVLIGVTK